MQFNAAFPEKAGRFCGIGILREQFLKFAAVALSFSAACGAACNGICICAAYAGSGEDKQHRKEGNMKKKYKIEVDCAACANKMEVAAKKTAGVKDAVVSFMAQKMEIEFEEGAEISTVMKNVSKACKKAEPDCEIFQ